MRGKRYENEKKIVSNAGGVNQYTVEVNAQIGHQPKNNSTAKIIADEYGVGYNTIRRNEHFAKTVDILPENVKEDVLANRTSISQTDAYIITKFDKPTQKKFIKEVESGTPIKEAVKKVDPKEKRRIDDENRATHSLTTCLLLPHRSRFII